MRPSGRAPDAIEQWRAVLERDPSRDDARTYIRMVQGPDIEHPVPDHDSACACELARDAAPGRTRTP